MNKIIEEAYYIIDNDATIREAAEYFAISKSVMHRHMSEGLKKLDYNLYMRVKKIFLEHNKIRHIHGGLATKRKYASG